MANVGDEIAQVNRIRLDEDLTFEALAGQIREVVNGGMDVTVLYRALMKPDYKPYERTVHKLRLFLEAHEARAKRKRTRRRPS